MSCYICTETGIDENVVQFSCNHYFHIGCLRAWFDFNIKHSKKCCYCTIHFNSEDLNLLGYNINEQFLHACEISNFEMLQHLIQQSEIKINQIQFIAFSIATKKKDSGLISFLIKNHLNHYDFSVSCIKKNKLKALTLILESGACPDKILDFSIINNYIEAIDLILNWSVNFTSAIKLACKIGDYSITKTLLENGADPCLENGLLLKIACINKNSRIVKLLLENGTYSSEAFDIAKKNCDISIIKILKKMK